MRGRRASGLAVLGLVGYDQLEQAIGAGDFAQQGSARSTLAGLQGLAVGDTAAPASERSQAVFDWTWAFVLRPVGEGCRLIAMGSG